VHYFKIRKQIQTNKNRFVKVKTTIKKRLSELRPGEEAIITQFDSSELFLKLMEMGCVPGERILLEQIAPMGDPISVNIAGYTLSLRLDEASHIEVELIN
jgi:Fe2+ transport system protein FeoA